MNQPEYRGLISFAGSRVRALALGVLANAQMPMSGYRVAKVAGLSEIKVYEALRRAQRVGLVKQSSEGFQLVDLPLKSYLRSQVRLHWSEERFRPSNRLKLRARPLAGPEWFDPGRYRPNPKVAERYRREFVRPPERDQPFSSGRSVGSRKRS